MNLHSMSSICYISPHIHNQWRLTIETDNDHIVWTGMNRSKLKEWAEEYFLHELDQAIYWTEEGMSIWADRVEDLESFRSSHLRQIAPLSVKLNPVSMNQLKNGKIRTHVGIVSSVGDV